MAPAICADQAPILPPSHHRGLARALHLDALTLVRRLQLLALCKLAVQLAHQRNQLTAALIAYPCQCA